MLHHTSPFKGAVRPWQEMELAWFRLSPSLSWTTYIAYHQKYPFKQASAILSSTWGIRRSWRRENEEGLLAGLMKMSVIISAILDGGKGVNRVVSGWRHGTETFSWKWVIGYKINSCGCDIINHSYFYKENQDTVWTTGVPGNIQRFDEQRTNEWKKWKWYTNAQIYV